MSETEFKTRLDGAKSVDQLIQECASLLTESKAPPKAATGPATIFRKHGVSRVDVLRFLADDAWKLELPPGTVTLFEVFAGRARLSETEEKLEGLAIHIGLDYGQDLSQRYQQGCLRACVEYMMPADVWISWPCKILGGWSHVNLAKKDPDTTDRLSFHLQGSREVRT